MNINIDLCTNKITCNRCNYNGKESKRNTYEELVEEFENNQNKNKEK